MRSVSLVLALLTLFLFPIAALPPQPADTYPALKQQAEASYAEKSFSRAHEIYQLAGRLDLQPAEKRWVEFRLADTLWRMDAANPGADSTRRDEARQALEALIRATGEDHDRIWADANESLGDSFWTHPSERNFGAAQPRYLTALDWWAGSDDVPLARRRYLDIVFRMTESGSGERTSRGEIQNVNSIPPQVLVNAESIAESATEQAHARYLLAMHFLSQYRPESIERALELLDQVILAGKSTPWYDDALFAAASRLAQGAVVVLESGETSFKPDFVKALDLYRRIVSEFAAGETRYRDEAKKAIESIVSPSVTVAVAGTFLPRSEQEVVLSWRNLRQVELTITAVDLLSNAQITNSNLGSWSDSIRSEGRSVLRRWTFQTNDRGDHAPGSERIRLTPKLEMGAYTLQASGGGRTAQQMILVTDANIVVHQSGGRSDVFVCDAVTGQPIAGARVRVWQQQQNGGIVSRDTQTNSSGLGSVQFDVPIGGATLVVASANRRQAFLSTYSYGNDPNRNAEWRIYAFTDRPAYRPDETVRWKFIARTRQDNRWATPAKESIDYEIVNPRGEKVASGRAALNDFGSFWSELPLTSSMPLGSYTIRFRKVGSEYDYIGDAQLFRLEEYKLPEFRVEVKTPEENGRIKQYRLGETIEATIEASYYFGGPVANATVEAVVYSRPLVHYWAGWREYPWYYQNPDYGYDQQVKRETLKTDARGRATVRIETPRDQGDKVFRIEARVTDASRREVAGQGSVRVTRQRYSVVAHPDHFLHRPNEKVSVEFKALDANEGPVQTTGTVKVIRRHWNEIWIDPMGRELTGRELDRLRASTVVFPPQPPAGGPSWRQKFAGYREEEVLTTSVTTDAKGEATLTFNAPREGYYVIRWTSEDRDPGRPARARDLVTAETTVWVSENATMELGYRASGLEIIVDKESFRAGQTAAAMIVTPASGRWVVLTTSANGILDTQVLQLDGTVKLVQFPLDDRHTPSFFMTASSVFDRALATTMKQIVVPPVDHFINVEVKPDREQYEPRQEAVVTVTTRNVDGKPVAAEVALTVFDESVTAIQSDLADDPRKFFFGELRGYALQVGASVQTQRYLALVEEEGTLVDDREPQRRGDARQNKDDEKRERDKLGALRSSAPSPVSESVTVTAASPAIDAAAKSVAAPIDVQVRSDFSSTAFWKPDILTGPDGVARVTVKFPEALTTWRAAARAVSTATQVGMGTSTVRTNLPLIVRLQAPRFFVAGDRVTVSAVINNNTEEAMRVTPSIEVEGLTLRGTSAGTPVDVPAQGESRADWTVAAERAGAAKLRVTARGAERGDAMERAFTVYEHGVDKLIARSGKLRSEEAIIKLDLPRDRRETSLVVQIQPSLAVTMLDALPYLIDYPYGCTEQTMSRFLPAAIVARTLTKNGLVPGDIEGRMFGGIERKHAAATHPEGSKDLRLLGRMTDRGMARLYDFQHSDGGWGWWKDGQSDDFMTAYVVWGFAVAKDGGLAVNENALTRAIEYLDRRLVQSEKAWQDQTWMLHAIAAWRAATREGTMNADERRAFDNVWTNRERLTAYSRALLALAAHDFGNAERAAILIRNLEDGVKIDRAPDQSVLVRGSGSSAAETMGTAHWGEDRFWWRWHDGPVESTAFALRALVRIDPKNRLIEPVMNWLVKNRRGAQWNNTRDTAVALLALNDYLGVSGELKGEVAYELSVNGRVIASKRITAAEVLSAPSRFVIDEAIVRDANEIRIRRTGGRADAPIYFAAEGRFVSLEEPVKAAGNELFVRRDYFRMAPRPTLLKGVVYDREPVRDNGVVRSGERVEVVVTIETKNDYDYLMFEDLKPAGLEAVALQSGEPLYARELRSATVTRKFAASEPVGEKPGEVRRASSADETSRTAWVYQELRDRKVALFIDHLPQGVWEIRYTLRAEVPGAFHALPLLGQAMYVPEIRANGDEVRLTVSD